MDTIREEVKGSFRNVDLFEECKDVGIYLDLPKGHIYLSGFTGGYCKVQSYCKQHYTEGVDANNYYKVDKYSTSKESWDRMVEMRDLTYVGMLV